MIQHLLPEFPMADRLVKRIHLTYPSKSQIPEPLRANIRSLEELNPDYQLTLYDDTDIERFIQEEFGSKVYAYYRRLDPCYGAARADLFRYLCVYRLGGVYVDIKSRMTLPLAQVLYDSDSFIVSQWDRTIDEGRFAEWGDRPGLEMVPGGEFQQWHVIARAGHPFLYAVLSKVLNNIDSYSPFRWGSGRKAVIRTTGPIAYTQAIYPILNQHPHRRVSIERDLGIHYSIYSKQDGARHIQHFSGHYSRQTHPLVATNPLVDTAYNILQRLITTARALRNRWRNRQLKTV